MVSKTSNVNIAYKRLRRLTGYGIFRIIRLNRFRAGTGTCAYFYPIDVVIGIPINGHKTSTANATTIIRIILAGIPYKKNSPGVNIFES